MKSSESNRLGERVQNNDIYLFGPMGVGKTTLVENIRKFTAVNYVSMGEITRRAIANNDPDIMRLISIGGKLPLEAVQSIIRPHISSEAPYLLDGVPRHPDEALWIKEHALNRRFGAIAVTLAADDDTIAERIYKRASLGQRAETPERIAARLETYRSNHQSILDTLAPMLDDDIEIDTTSLSSQEVFNCLQERI